MRSKAARISLISISLLIVLGIVTLTLIFFGFNRLFLVGIFSHGLLNVCQVIGNSCRITLFSLASLIRNPGQVLMITALLAVVVVLIKGILVFLYSRHLLTHFLAVETLPGKLKRVVTRFFKDKLLVIRISESDEPLAFTIGFIKPSICLTKGLIRRLTEQELAGVIAHEYAHIKRRDNIAVFLGLLVRDLLYLLPLAHFLFALFTREKEHAADEIAAKLTNRPLDLASAILAISRIKVERNLVTAYSAFTPLGATVESRVKRLLEGEKLPERYFGQMLVSFLTSILIFSMAVGVAVAEPAKVAVKKNCHIGGGCNYIQDHGQKELNICLTKNM
jgi:beta-lactamase regulating signal transducer with metallopeptidase domain